MRIKALRNCDVRDERGDPKALFDGQEYDLPDDVAQTLIEDGAAASLATPASSSDSVKAVEETPEDKAVEGPERTKAVRPQQNKGRG